MQDKPKTPEREAFDATYAYCTQKTPAQAAKAKQLAEKWSDEAWAARLAKRQEKLNKQARPA